MKELSCTIAARIKDGLPALCPDPPKFPVGTYCMNICGLVAIEDVKWQSVRGGWIYGLALFNTNDTPGGFSYWSEERELSPVSDPLQILRAGLIEGQRELSQLEQRRKMVSAKLEHIQYALNLVRGEKKK